MNISIETKDKIHKSFLYKLYRLAKSPIRHYHTKKRLYKKIESIEEVVKPLLKNCEETSVITPITKDERNIFVLWWQGFDNASFVVKKCLESIYKYYSDWNIVKLDRNNIFDYVTFPDEIKGKFHFDGVDKSIKNDRIGDDISIQTFSDLVRFQLLYKYGGVWIDSTIFFTKKFDLDKFLTYSSFNSLHTKTREEYYLYKGRHHMITSFFLAGRKGNVICKKFGEMGELVLTTTKYRYYFFIDFLVMIMNVYHIDNDAIDKIPLIEGEPHYLRPRLNCRYNDKLRLECEKLPQKMNWEKELPENIDGTMSKYYFFN